MSGEFAKLFGSGEKQIVVINQSSDDGHPEVRTFFTTEELGVSSVAISFKDDEAGEKAADKLFSLMTEEGCRNAINKTLERLSIEEGPI